MLDLLARGRVCVLAALLCALSPLSALADPPQTAEEKWRVSVVFTTVDPATGGVKQAECDAIPASPLLIVVMGECHVAWEPRLTFVRPRGAHKWTPVSNEFAYSAEQTGACPMVILELSSPLPRDYPLETWRSACAAPRNEGSRT